VRHSGPREVDVLSPVYQRLCAMSSERWEKFPLYLTTSSGGRPAGNRVNGFVVNLNASWSAVGPQIMRTKTVDARESKPEKHILRSLI
jgi:hypothetical protein